MKKTIRMAVAVLCLAALFTAFLPVNGRAYAADEGTVAVYGNRLSIENSVYRINGEGTVRIRLNKREKTEDVRVTVEKSSAATVEKVKWYGDILVVKITALKSKVTTLKVRFEDEEQKATLVLDKGKKLSAEDMYSYLYDAMVEVKTVDSVGNVYVGSGFFVGNGEVITNYHVVESASKIVIKDYYGKKYTIKKILNYSTSDDLILFKVTEGNKGSLSIAKSSRGGERIYCMGSPLGLTGSFVTGVVSNPMIYVGGTKCVQISMPSGTGIGGAPIVNSKGQVVGVMCMTVPEAKNICFAVDNTSTSAFLQKYTDKDGQKMEQFYQERLDEVKESNYYWKDAEPEPQPEGEAYSEEALTGSEVYDSAYHAMVEIICMFGKYSNLGYSTGSGFFISEDTIVTNWHVIDDYTYLYIYDYDQNRYELIGEPLYNKNADIAMIKVKAADGGSLKNHTSIEAAPDYVPRAGETIYTFGNPALCNATFAEGNVMKANYALDGYDHIVISNPIYEGSSGGVLLNKYGQAIGVTGIKLQEIESAGMAISIKYLDIL